MKIITGVIPFVQRSSGKDAQEAFYSLVSPVQCKFGYSSSRTIADKTEFVEIPRDESVPVIKQADRLMSASDPRASARGPAMCIDCGEGKFLFFGWVET